MQLTSAHHKSVVGFTLIEVLVTVVVVSIGLLGLAGLQISGLRANMSSEARSKATLLASDIIERMRANPLGVDANGYAAIDTNLDCNANSPSPFCSNTSTSGIAEDCTPAEMAVFDAWVWACGLPVGDAQRSGVQNILLNGAAAITCNDNDAADTDICSPGSPHTVTVSWDEGSPNATDTINAGDIQTQTISLTVTP